MQGQPEPRNHRVGQRSVQVNLLTYRKVERVGDMSETKLIGRSRKALNVALLVVVAASSLLARHAEASGEVRLTPHRISNEVLRRAMDSDPDLFAKVAANNKMTPARFMGQEEGRIIRMVKDYLAERDDLRSSATTASSAK